MNFKISEKEVLYRINNNTYKKQKTIGEYIRKERLAQGLKQEVVCKDICSVSYYSRIESCKVVPSNIYIKKIFKKLNKPIPKIYNQEYNQEIKDVINNFLAAIEYKNDHNVKEEFMKIKDIQDINYDLYEFVYLIYFKDTSNIKPLINKLHQQQIHFDNDELLLYLEYLATYYVLNNEIKEAKNYLKMALKLQKSMGISKPSILYKYAWVLGKMNNNYQCINYAEEADKKFTENNNTYRSIQCKMLIVIKLCNFFPNKAIQMYKNIIKLAKQKHYLHFEKISIYNLSILLKKNNYFTEAEEYFIMILNNYSDDNNLRINIYIEYIDLLVYLSQHNKAKLYFSKLREMELDSESYSFYVKYYDCTLLKENNKDKLRIYQNELIPFSVKSNNLTLELRLRKEYVKLLEHTLNYKKMVFEYKRILEIKEMY